MEIKWNIDHEGTLTIEGAGRLPDFRRDFCPESAYWKSDSPSVRKVVIGEGITEIGTRAFENCTNLKEAVFPSSLSRIHAYAFRNCTSLDKISAGNRSFVYAFDQSADKEKDSPVIFGTESFSRVPWAEEHFGSFYISDGILYICFQLHGEIRIPESVRIISGFSFMNVKAEKLELPESLEQIEQYAFLNAAFTKIVVPARRERLQSEYAYSEIAASLGEPRTAENIRKVKVPFLYEIKSRRAWHMEKYKKLVTGEKKAPVRKDGNCTGVWGRELIDVGASLLRRLKRGGLLIRLVYDQNKIGSISSYVWDWEKPDEKLQVFTGSPCIEDGAAEIRESCLMGVKEKHFRSLFKVTEGKELTEKGVLRILPDIREEWFWRPADRPDQESGTEVCKWDYLKYGGKNEREFLEELEGNVPGIIPEK